MCKTPDTQCCLATSAGLAAKLKFARTDMHWPPVHQKSKQTIFKMLGHTFVYTNEGYRLGGTWDRTTAAWTEGTCIIEFARKCSDPEKVGTGAVTAVALLFPKFG